MEAPTCERRISLFFSLGVSLAMKYCPRRSVYSTQVSLDALKALTRPRLAMDPILVAKKICGNSTIRDALNIMIINE